MGKAVRQRLLQVREPLDVRHGEELLTNEVYTGNLIQNQTGSRSYKDDTMIYKPESEWIRHEALHEAIISPEVWNEVQGHQPGKDAALGGQRAAEALPVHRQARLRRL